MAEIAPHPHVDLVVLRDMGACRACPASEVDRLFFNEEKEEEYQEKAINDYCATCPVREQCLQYAVENLLDFGVWGGLTEIEREPLLEVERITHGLERELEESQRTFQKLLTLFQPID